MRNMGCNLIRIFIVIVFFICFFTAISNQSSVDLAFAQVDNGFISSAEGNGIWILNKSNGNLTYLQFQNQNETFRSDSISVSSEFDLNNCQLHAFGRRGIVVLIADLYSGSLAVYKVNGDKTVERCIKKTHDKNIMLCGKGKNFWVLDKVSRKIIFFQCKSENKIQKSPPIPIPSHFNLESTNIESVGTHGEGVFLFDTSTGITKFYTISHVNWKIEEYMDVDI